MSETVYWIWLSGCLEGEAGQLHRLLENYETPYDIFRAEEGEFKLLNLDKRVISSLCCKDMRHAYAINDYCALHKIGIVTYDSEYYPRRLRNIPDPPPVLYFRGTFPNFNDNLSISVVGTRKMSEYGKRMAYKISYELASANVIVVSGMALGIDAIASCGAIIGGGKTVAVLGGGVDVIYPQEHTKLYEKIIENGAVISEYAPMTEPKAQNFPQRNRIISGLSVGTLVVECDMRSGALITADKAKSQGKSVFTIPRSIGDINSEGTNRLIQDGAVVVMETDDILNEYEFYYGKKLNYLALGIAKSHSEPNEDAIRSMGISYRKKSFAGDDMGGGMRTQTSVENSLKPRNIPKVRETGEMPSTESEKQRNKTEEKGMSTEEELSMLTEQEKSMFSSMPDDRAIGVDELMRLGFGCSDIMGTMAMLEIKGLVSSLPGGLYIKN